MNPILSPHAGRKCLMPRFAALPSALHGTGFLWALLAVGMIPFAAAGQTAASSNLSSSASSHSPPPSPARLIDRIVAEVDGEVITARDLSFWIWQERLLQPNTQRLPDSALAPQLLRNLADEILMAHWAEESIKEIDENEIDQAAEKDLGNLRTLAPTRSGFDSWLADAGFDVETVRRYLRDREQRIWLIRSALAMHHNVRPEQIEGSEKSKESAAEQPVRVQLRQILLKCLPRADDAETSRVLLRALAIRREILAGTSFADAAMLYSDDPATREAGGEAGWVTVKDLRPALRSAVQELQKGEVSPPVRTSQGWHLLQVTDLETPTMRELMEQVRAAYESALDEQRNERGIRVAEGYTIAPPGSRRPEEGDNDLTPDGSE